MEPLSRREEQVLLAVWELQDEAYLLSIRGHLSRITQKNWSVGIIHKPLLKLEKKGFITSSMGGATAKRGGRRKKLYRTTALGVDALKALRHEQDAMWENFLRHEILGETE
jgi:DNA-binding PadR family transcriptional regulator